MPKNIHTPRDELVCGKLDQVREKLIHLGAFKRNGDAIVEIMDLIQDITRDCERMELKLIQRKQEAEH